MRGESEVVIPGAVVSCELKNYCIEYRGEEDINTFSSLDCSACISEEVYGDISTYIFTDKVKYVCIIRSCNILEENVEGYGEGSRNEVVFGAFHIMQYQALQGFHNLIREAQG